MAAIAGAVTWGFADEPRGVQLTRGLEYFTHLRKHQRQVQQAITELEQMNARANDRPSNPTRHTTQAEATYAKDEPT